jgi:uncharacterized protein
MTQTPDPLLSRIAEALERLVPSAPPALPSLAGGGLFRWQAGAAGSAGRLAAVAHPRRVPLDLLLGMDTQKQRLLANVERFARGLPANHALLWGARGTGKSALAKAVHGAVAASHPGLALIEVARGEIASVPDLLSRVEREARIILFIDDLSFDAAEDGYKALKAVLDGGVDGAMAADTGRVLVLVTSNRRHLVARTAQAGAPDDFRPDESMEEQVSLSDRFGLWLGFHAMDQSTYLAIVRAYCERLSLRANDPALDSEALRWSLARGARSGRTAWQFVVDRAGASGRSVDLEGTGT